MPRIEIIPAEDTDDPTPTLDVCHDCAELFDREGEPVPEEIEGDYPGATVGSTDVEHPPYEDTEYKCDICGEDLTSRDE